MTPEGKVKAEVKKILDKYEGRIYYHMPVPTGFGRSSLDYLGFFYGRGFAIETKRAGKEPTKRQEGIAEDITASGTPVFVIIGLGSTGALEAWLEMVETQCLRADG